MKKHLIFGLVAGAAAGTAAVLAVKAAVDKISKEIKNGIVEEEFDSPFGDNWVKVSIGSSETAKGITFIKIKAETDRNEDDCKLVFFAKKDAAISYEWEDNDHFKLLVGEGKHKQCCDVIFGDKEITAQCYPIKIEIDV